MEASPLLPGPGWGGGRGAKPTAQTPPRSSPQPPGQFVCWRRGAEAPPPPPQVSLPSSPASAAPPARRSPQPSPPPPPAGLKPSVRRWEGPRPGPAVLLDRRSGAAGTAWFPAGGAGAALLWGGGAGPGAELRAPGSGGGGGAGWLAGGREEEEGGGCERPGRAPQDAAVLTQDLWPAVDAALRARSRARWARR